MAAQHSTTSNFYSRYKFNGKELDKETGYYTNWELKYSINKLEYIFLFQGKNSLHSRSYGNNFLTQKEENRNDLYRVFYFSIGINYGARYYEPSVSQWLSVDPLVAKYPAYSPYNYTLDNPVVLVDPDGRGVETDFFNLKGKLVKHVNDDKTDKKIVLTNRKGLGKVNKMINSGLVINLPSENEIKKMEKAYTESENHNNNEYGYAVATDGTISTLVTSNNRGKLESSGAAIHELLGLGKKVSYAAHVHGNIIVSDDGEGHFTVSSPTPSRGDSQDVGIKKAQENLGRSTQPSVILGYSIGIGDDGKPDLKNSTRTLGFYTGNKKQKAVKVNFESFKETVKKINGQ